MNTILDDLYNHTTANQLIDRFKKYGEIIHTIKRGDETVKIGKIPAEPIFVVFYPDGEYDRFEDTPVVYREGWSGPELPSIELPLKNTVIEKKSTKKSTSTVAITPTPDKKPAKKPAKKNEMVDAWFALLGAEKPKPRARSKKSKAATKH